MTQSHILVATLLSVATPAVADGPWFRWLLERENPRHFGLQFLPTISGDGRFAFFPASTTTLQPVSTDLIRMDLTHGETTIIGSWDWCQALTWWMRPTRDGDGGFGFLRPSSFPGEHYFLWEAGSGGAWWDGEYPLLYGYSASGRSRFGHASPSKGQLFTAPVQQLPDGEIIEYERPQNTFYCTITAIGEDESLAAGYAELVQQDDSRMQVGIVWRDGQIQYRHEDPSVVIARPLQVDSSTGRIAGVCLLADGETQDLFIWHPSEGLRLVGIEEDLSNGGPLISVDLNSAIWRRWTPSLEHGVESSAVLWRRGLGVSTTASILVQEFGFDLSGALTIDITSLSDDGQTVVGIARFDGDTPCGMPNFVPFAAHIPFRMPGDTNRDFQIDGADLGNVLGAWGTSDARADFNADGVVDGADLGIVLAAWENDGSE